MATSTITVTDLNGFNGSVSSGRVRSAQRRNRRVQSEPHNHDQHAHSDGERTATIGTFTVTITGTSGSLIATTTLYA